LLCCCSVEEQQLQDKMQAEHHEDGFDMDEASHRLNEIYERMQEVRHAVNSLAASRKVVVVDIQHIRR
jgi:hypothetical protein